MDRYSTQKVLVQKDQEEREKKYKEAPINFHAFWLRLKLVETEAEKPQFLIYPQTIATSQYTRISLAVIEEHQD